MPSARNSGLLRISNSTPGAVQLRRSTFSMASAVLTGTVLFSTMILLLVLTLAIMRAAPSQYVRSAALPAPIPLVLVGVLTLSGGVRCFGGSARNTPDKDDIRLGDVLGGIGGEK